MARSHEELTVEQFGPNAASYVASAVHAGGADLDALALLAKAAAPKRALDLGAGGGHVAYRLAPCAGKVMAVDLSHQMLAAVSEQARARKLANIETVAAPVEQLPFGPEEFDFVASRFSAHHWRDLQAGLREARRVTRAGSAAIFIDVVSPGAAALDTHLQAVELLRDPSHVRDYSLSEWTAALAGSGFQVRQCRSWRLRMDFAVWTARMRTPEPLVCALRNLQQAASSATRGHFAIEDDGSFLLDVAMLETVADGDV